MWLRVFLNQAWSQVNFFLRGGREMVVKKGLRNVSFCNLWHFKSELVQLGYCCTLCKYIEFGATLMVGFVCFHVLNWPLISMCICRSFSYKTLWEKNVRRDLNWQKSWVKQKKNYYNWRSHPVSFSARGFHFIHQDVSVQVALCLRISSLKYQLIHIPYKFACSLVSLWEKS